MLISKGSFFSINGPYYHYLEVTVNMKIVNIDCDRVLRRVYCTFAPSLYAKEAHPTERDRCFSPMELFVSANEDQLANVIGSKAENWAGPSTVG